MHVRCCAALHNVGMLRLAWVHSVNPGALSMTAFLGILRGPSEDFLNGYTESLTDSPERMCDAVLLLHKARDASAA